MPYQPSENCYYMSLKSVAEWNAPDNKTSKESKHRYNKLLTTNLRQKSYQRAKDNNIKRWLELKDKLQQEPPIDYIDKMVQAYANNEIKISEILVQSCTAPSKPGAAPQRCYLLGKRNIIKVKSYEKIENDVGESKAIGSLLLADFCLIFEVYNVDNKNTGRFISDITSNPIYFLSKVMEYWECNIKRPEAKTLVAPTGTIPHNDSEMDVDIDDETEILDASESGYEDYDTTFEYNNDMDLITGDEPLDGFEVDNYGYTNDGDVQINQNSSEAPEYDSYSDLTDNLNDFL